MKRNGVKKTAKSFLHEEKEAVKDYKKGAKKTKSKGLKKVLRHNLKEEREHAKALKKYS